MNETKTQFEDVFPIKHVDFPLSRWFSRVQTIGILEKTFAF